MLHIQRVLSRLLGRSLRRSSAAGTWASSGGSFDVHSVSLGAGKVNHPSVLLAKSLILYVLPGLPIKNVINRSPLQLELGSQIKHPLSRFIGCANIFHILFLQFMTWMAFTFHVAAAMSSLFDHISGIAFPSSKKQMIWSHTRRIIACVTNQFTGRDATEMNLPRSAMRFYFAAFINANRPISIWTWHRAAGPKPTPFSFVDGVPEPFFERDYGASFATKFCSLPETGTIGSEIYATS